MTILLALMGCPYVADGGFEERVQDVDGDGLEAERFGGRDCDDTDPDVGDCDADRDGVRSVRFGGTDCDDTTAAVQPGADEVCDGIDNDCDGRIDDLDDDVTGQTPFFVDRDDDGFGAGSALLRCEAPAGTVAFDGDCDDTSSTVNPGAAESCDAVDRNCDGDSVAGATRDWFADADGDGFGDPTALLATTCDRPDPSAVTNAFDCDNDDALAHPSDVQTGLLEEICDGIDNDCDGLIDDDDPDLAATVTLGFPDADGDGFGDASAAEDLYCNGVPLGTDCDDADPSINPGATERCDSAGPGGIDGVDEDCDGLRGSLDPDNDGGIVWFRDNDDDQFGITSDPRPVCTDDGVSGFSPDGGDCNDQDPTIQSSVSWYPDVDLDGFGSQQAEPDTQCFPPAGHVRDNTDCDDGENSFRPGALEICDGFDNDCDGNIDEGAVGAVLGFPDADGDGFGVGTERQVLCDIDIDVAIVQVGGDCDDDPDPEGQGALTFPGAVQTCGDDDFNCNGLIDEADPLLVPTRWYLDADLDGFGSTNPDDPVLDQCDAPLGYVVVSNDCNDDRPLQYFATYRGAASDAGGRRVDDLAEVLDNPGRCTPEGDSTQRTVVELDDEAVLFIEPRSSSATPTPLSIDARTTIALEGPLGGHGTVCWDPSVTIDVTGALELTRVDLVFGTRVANPQLAGDDCLPAGLADRPLIRMMGDGLDDGDDTDIGLILNRVHLTDVRLGRPDDTPLFAPVPPAFQQPFIAQGPASDDHAAVELVDLDWQEVPLARGLVELPDLFATMRLQSVALDVSGGDAGLLSVSRVALDDRADGIELDDVRIRGTLPAGLVQRVGTSTDRFVVHGRRVDVETDVSATPGGPLFCLEQGGCAGSPATTGPDGAPMLDLRESVVHGPPLARLPTGGILHTTAMHGGPAVATPAWVTFSGSPLPTTRVTSTRDRLEGPIAFDGHTTDLTFRSTHVAGSLQVEDPFATTRLTGVSIVAGSLDVGAVATLEAAGVVLVDDALAIVPSSFVPDDDAFYTVGATDPVPCVDDPAVPCLQLDDPVSVTRRGQLVRYGPATDPNQMIPFPRFTCLPPPAEDHLFYDGVCWTLDPNTDGLPTAMLQLFASHPSCWDYGVAVFGPQADPDGDGVTNREEYEAGTWPCDPLPTP